MYKHDSEIARDACKKMGFYFKIHPLKAMRRHGRIYIKGTALKPDEDRDLQYQCRMAGYIYKP